MNFLAFNFMLREQLRLLYLCWVAVITGPVAVVDSASDGYMVNTWCPPTRPWEHIRDPEKVSVVQKLMVSWGRQAHSL